MVRDRYPYGVVERFNTNTNNILLYSTHSFSLSPTTPSTPSTPSIHSLPPARPAETHPELATRQPQAPLDSRLIGTPTKGPSAKARALARLAAPVIADMQRARNSLLRCTVQVSPPSSSFKTRRPDERAAQGGGASDDETAGDQGDPARDRDNHAREHGVDTSSTPTGRRSP
jgi:hypothetical protein